MEWTLQCCRMLFTVLIAMCALFLILVENSNYVTHLRSFTSLFMDSLPKSATVEIFAPAIHSSKVVEQKMSNLECLDKNAWTVECNNCSYTVIFHQICNISVLTNVVTEHMEIFHAKTRAHEANISTSIPRDRNKITRILYGTNYLVSPLEDKIFTHTDDAKIFVVKLPPITRIEEWRALSLDVQDMYALQPAVRTCSAANLSQQCGQHLNLTAYLTPAPLNIKGNESYIFPFHVHRILNAFVDASGNVHGIDSCADVIPLQCNQKNISVMYDANRHNLKRHHVVFVISQYRGRAYYHHNVNCQPRLSIFINFLRRHPDIKIHIRNSIAKLQLDALGLANEVVAGQIQAQVVYIPQGGGCMGRSNHLFAVPILHQLYSKMPMRSTDKCERQSIVLIKRHEKRWLAQNNAILKLLLELVSETGYNFKVQLFSDYPKPPTFLDTVSIFSHAALVIGAHGAGMANLMFAQPQTYIVEIQCSCRKIQCYRALAENLGHIFIQVIGQSTDDCIPGIKRNCGAIHVDLPYLKLLLTSIIHKIHENNKTCM